MDVARDQIIWPPQVTVRGSAHNAMVLVAEQP